MALDIMPGPLVTWSVVTLLQKSHVLREELAFWIQGMDVPGLLCGAPDCDFLTHPRLEDFEIVAG